MIETQNDFDPLSPILYRWLWRKHFCCSNLTCYNLKNVLRPFLELGRDCDSNSFMEYKILFDIIQQEKTFFFKLFGLIHEYMSCLLAEVFCLISFPGFCLAFGFRFVWLCIQEMLLLLLPLLNSSAIKNLLSPFAKERSSSNKEDTVACPICQVDPATPFIALPCQHRYGLTSANLVDQSRVITLPLSSDM